MRTDIKILAIAAFTVPYIRNNWGAALRQRFGHNVTCLNANPFLVGKKRHILNEYIYRLIKHDDYHFCFFYHDWIFNDFTGAFFDQLRSCGIPILTFYPDDEPESWYERNQPYDHHYDLIATHSKRGFSRRQRDGFGDHVLYLPWGFNPRVFRRRNAVEPIYDIVFIGKNKVHENESTLYREDGKNRHDALISLADAARNNGWRYKIFGYGWEKHPVLKDFAGGIPSDQGIVDIYNRTRIVFNPAWSSDDGQQQPQTKLRHFEVPGCGAFQLTNENTELAELFEPSKELVFYHDNAEMIEKTSYYLNHEAERQSIATAGWKRGHQEHTLGHRVRTLFQHALQLWPEKPASVSEVPLKIKKFHLKNHADLEQLAAQLVDSGEAWHSYDALHFIAGDFKSEDVDYGAVAQYIRSGRFPVIGVRTFFSYQGLAANVLQPTREEIAGDFIKETYSWEEIHPHNRSAVKKAFVQIDEHLSGACLINFLSKPELATALLNAFINNSMGQLEAMAPFYTGCLVNEVSLDKGWLSTANRRHLGAPPYIHHLSVAVEKSKRNDHRVVLYGANGLMAERALSFIFSQSGFQLAGIIDNGMIGKTIHGMVIHGHDEILSLKPDMVIIAAAYSGPSIWKDLQAWRGRTELLPLYDLSHAAWDLLIP